MTTVPEEAVKAAILAYQEEAKKEINHFPVMMRAALTAAIPFLPVQGAVTVKSLDWGKSSVSEQDKAQTVVGLYFISNHTVDAHNLMFDNDQITALLSVHTSLEAAKAAAQADYEARILSAIETGIAVSAPSPRAQALEEAEGAIDELRLQAFRTNSDADRQAYFDAVSKWFQDRHYRRMDAERSLSSQPVADGWLPTHRHKKRGTDYSLIGIGKMQADNWQVSREGFDQSIDMEEVAIYRSVDDGSLWVRPREEFEDGRFETIPTPPSGEVA